MEDGVKTKTPKAYGAIEDGMDTVMKGIKGKNKEDALTSLQALNTSILSAAK